jgi:hypothetical protein
MSGYKYLPNECFKFILESESILKPILQANYDKNKNHKSNYTGNLWKSVIDFSIPKDEHHEFWHRSGLNRRDGNFQNSISLQILSFGASRQEAKMFAFIKLKNLIELIRTILSIKTKDIDLLISKLLREPITPSFPMNYPALDMGVRLFKFYGRHQKEQNILHSITTFIKQLLETCPTELQPLLKYCLVYPPSVSNVDISYHSSRKTCRSSWISYIAADLSTTQPFRFKEIGGTSTIILFIWPGYSRVVRNRGIFAELSFQKD